MDDFYELVVGLTVCVVPLLVIGGLIALIVRLSRGSGESARLAELELDLARLRGQNATLLHRVSRLEAWANEQVQRAQAQAPVVPPASERPAQAPEERATIPDAAASAPQASVQIAIVAAPPAPLATAATGGSTTAIAEGGAEAAAVAGAGAGASAGPSATAAGAGAGPAVGPTTTGAGAGGGPGATTAVAGAGAAPVRIDWESWIGVRGAAALGAIILVIAGVYFFEYSIEHGLITPAMRMVAGTLVGLGCVLAGELRLRRTHNVLASWLAGAGVAILYLAFWAGKALYLLYPTWVASILLIAVTAACVTLAVRRGSLPIAILGLCGGFATPMALSTGEDHPIPLFGYILLLDAAMLWVAWRKRWAWMGLLCLLATAFYQNAWLLGRLDEPRLVLGVVIAVVFTILFAALPSAKDESGKESAVWRFSRSAGVALPLLFTLVLAARTDLGAHFWPTSIQLVLLCGAACWVGRRHASGVLPVMAALAASGAVLGWALAHPPADAWDAWKLVGLALVTTIVFHVNAELDRSPARASGLASPAAVVGMLGAVLIVAPFSSLAPWPWLAALAGLLAIGLRSGDFQGRAVLQVPIAGLVGLGLALVHGAGTGGDGQPAPGLVIGLLVAVVLLAQLAGVLPRGLEGRRYGDHAAALLALALLVAIPCASHIERIGGGALYASTLVCALLALMAATRRGASGWLPAALGASALAHAIWIARIDTPSLLDLGMLSIAVLLFAVWPIVSPSRLRDQPWAWRTAALAGPAYLLALRHVYLEALGPSTIGLLPVALGLVSIGAAYAVRVRGPDPAEARRVAIVWLTASAAGFVTLAIPMQLANEWLTIGWALEALALSVLWYRLDHPGLKYLALGLGLAICVRLCFNPYLLDYYPRGSLRILNWLAYTYLVPAASLAGMWRLYGTREIERRRPWERSVLGTRAVVGALCASGAVAVVFVWINLAIFDWFATGDALTIPLERLPARDLTLSIAWGIYALVLLAIGVIRKSTVMRWVSLVLITLTSGKVFLYDLAHLRDLYLVASLAGLAVTLILISLAYRRFVFRRPEEPQR